MSQLWSTWGLRVLAVALAILAWSILGVGQREQTGETTVEPFVTYRLPENLMILDSQDRVRVRLQGPASIIGSLNPFQVSVVVELRDAEIGRQERALTGDNASHVVSYGTEAGQFQEAGYSAVICGPGDIAQAHQPNEFITISQFNAGQKFMERLVERLCE